MYIGFETRCQILNPNRGPVNVNHLPHALQGF
jgi:hypothetical protein